MTKDEALLIALEALEAHADIGIKADKAITAIKAALEAKDESVCKDCNGTGAADSGGTHPWGESIFIRCHCTYPTPPQRKPLTVEEIWACLPKDPDEMVFARAIEAAHGIT